MRVRDRVRMCFAGSTRLQGSLCQTQPGNINKNNRHQTKDHATRRVTRIRYVNRDCKHARVKDIVCVHYLVCYLVANSHAFFFAAEDLH